MEFIDYTGKITQTLHSPNESVSLRNGTFW